MEFTENQLSLMGAEDKEDIARADAMGFDKPRYIRMTPNIHGEIQTTEQLFSPVVLGIVSGGKRYPENATRLYCERLIHIWNESARSQYALV
jgi:hypothetical protein